MKRVAWMTDVHLNVLSVEAAEAFLADVADERPDALLVGGDVAESPELARALKRIAAAVACPVYFVLGNHDYYFSSIHRVRRDIAELCERTERLHWLSGAPPVALTPTVGLIGHDGWCDGRLGDYARSLVMMNDYRFIDDFVHLDKMTRLDVMRRLADEAAGDVERVLPAALDRFEQVVFLTHAPPFRGACWYEGRISDDQWAPHFTCKAVGDVLRRCAESRPDRRITVLCGHTHSEGEAQILPNLLVLTGGAQYGAPCVQRCFEFE